MALHRTTLRYIVVVIVVAGVVGMATIATGAGVPVASFALDTPTGDDGPVDRMAADLSITPHPGPNGAYAYLNENDRIRIDLTETNPALSGGGVNPGSTTDIDDVFVITYTGEESVTVGIEHTDQAVDVTFRSDDGQDLSEFVELDAAERHSVSVGLEVDATAVDAGTRDSITFEILCQGCTDSAGGLGSSGSASSSGDTVAWIDRCAPDELEARVAGVDRGDRLELTFDCPAFGASAVTLDGLEATTQQAGAFTITAVGGDTPPGAVEPTDGIGRSTHGYVRFDHGMAGDLSDVEVAFSVSRARLEAVGADPGDVRLYEFAGGEWRERPTAVVGDTDHANHEYPDRDHADSDHVRFVGEPEGLTPVAVGIHEPAVTVRHATLDDTAVVAGEPVTITMTIANEGLAEGTRTLELLADGATVATERVRLEAGGTLDVTAEVTVEIPGEHRLTVDDTPIGTVIVESPGESDRPQSLESPESPESPASAVAPLDATETVPSGSGLAVIWLFGAVLLSVLVGSRMRRDR